MKMIRWMTFAAAMAVLSACGSGGSDAGTPSFGNSTGVGGSNAGGGTNSPNTNPALSVSDIVLELNKSTIANTGTDEITVKAIAIDGNRNTVSKVPILLSSNNEAILAVSGVETGDDGSLVAKLTVGSNRSNRVIGVQASVNGIVRSASVQVFGAKLSGTVVPQVLQPGETGKVIFRLVDNVSAPMVGQAFQVTTSGLSPARLTGQTDSKGEFEFPFTAPTAGTFAFEATAGGATINPAPSVTVQTTASAGAISGVVRSISVSANPSVVNVNTFGSTANRTEVRALLVGDNNQPIRNARVWFDLDGDVNRIGGTFSVGSSQILYSDANGIVTTAYIPGTRASPTDGVTVRVCVSAVDVTLPATCPAAPAGSTNTTKLTVTSEALGVSVGAGNVVEQPPGNVMYQRRLLVSVVDAAGLAKADVPLSVVVDLPRFYVGEWVVVGGLWRQRAIGECDNEDRNRNGVREPGEDDQVPGNNRLDPGKSDVSVQLLHPRTRADGTAEVLVSYAASFGSWVTYEVTVTASGVSGSEFSAKYVEDPAPVPSTALASPNVAPPFIYSPYSRQLGGCRALPVTF